MQSQCIFALENQNSHETAEINIKHSTTVHCLSSPNSLLHDVTIQNTDKTRTQSCALALILYSLGITGVIVMTNHFMAQASPNSQSLIWFKSTFTCDPRIIFNAQKNNFLFQSDILLFFTDIWSKIIMKLTGKKYKLHHSHIKINCNSNKICIWKCCPCLTKSIWGYNLTLRIPWETKLLTHPK